MANPPIDSTTDALVALTSKRLGEIFSQALSPFPSLTEEVQAFHEFQSGEFLCSSPLNVKTLLSDSFWRTFDPCLKSAIDEVLTHKTLNKEKLPSALLDKYIGTNESPNAYHSLPNDNEPDAQLHLFFLQPFKLFGIDEKNRKYKGVNLITYHREWLWRASSQHSDCAPLFRKIIQTYLIASLIDTDTNFSNVNNLNLKHEKLLHEIKQDLEALFRIISAPANTGSFIATVKQGILNDPDFTQMLEKHMPGFINLAKQYALGRLLFGQKTFHSRDSQTTSWTNVFLVSSIRFYFKTIFLLCIKAIHNLTQYILTPEAKFKQLATHVLIFIPIITLIILSPLAVVLPLAWGLSSLPFNLLRKIQQFKKHQYRDIFKILIDILCAVKDISILCLTLPYTAAYFNLLCTAVPSALLPMGFLLSFMFYTALFACQVNSVNSAVPAEMIIQFATLTNSLAIGFALTLSATCYVGLGVLGKLAGDYLPIKSLASLAQRWVNSILKAAVCSSYDNIIPAAYRQVNLTLPTTQRTILSEESKIQAKQIVLQLGKLNQAFNLDRATKIEIKNCLLALDEETTPSMEDFSKAIEKAKTILQNNFDAQEATLMSELLLQLKTAQVQINNTENIALRIQGQVGSYQPSLTLLKTLREKGIIQADGTWQAAGISIPAQMQEKCRRITALYLQ